MSLNRKLDRLEPVFKKEFLIIERRIGKLGSNGLVGNRNLILSLRPLGGLKHNSLGKLGCCRHLYLVSDIFGHREHLCSLWLVR